MWPTTDEASCYGTLLIPTFRNHSSVVMDGTTHLRHRSPIIAVASSSCATARDDENSSSALRTLNQRITDCSLLSGSRGCGASSSRMTAALRKILLRSQCQLHCNRLSFTSPSSLRALNSRLWPCTRHYPRQLIGRVHLFSTHTPFKSSASATTVGAARTAATITSTTPTIIRDLLLQHLQQILLKPRSLPLPRYISPQHYSFTLSELFGHASFILIAASYYTQDFVQLRVMAILGSTAMLAFTYFHPHGRVLWLPLKWNALFIAINAWRVGKVYFLRYRAENLSEEMKEFRREHLGLFDMVDYYNLISMGVEEVFEEGDLIIHQVR